MPSVALIGEKFQLSPRWYAAFVAAHRADGLRRVEDLLDAALACFAEHGVVGARLDEIRRRAGASPSSVYHLFGGLEGVLVGLLERTFARLFEHLAARLARVQSAESAVKRLVGAHLEWVLRNRDEARVMYQAMSLELSPSASARLAAKKAELIAPLAARLRPFVASGALPSWDPTLLDVALLGVTHEACRRLLAGAAIDPAWARRELPRIAWAGVAHSRAGPRARRTRRR